MQARRSHTAARSGPNLPVDDDIEDQSSSYVLSAHSLKAPLVDKPSWGPPKKYAMIAGGVFLVLGTAIAAVILLTGQGPRSADKSNSADSEKAVAASMGVNSTSTTTAAAPTQTPSPQPSSSPSSSNSTTTSTSTTTSAETAALSYANSTAAATTPAATAPTSTAPASTAPAANTSAVTPTPSVPSVPIPVSIVQLLDPTAVPLPPAGNGYTGTHPACVSGTWNTPTPGTDVTTKQAALRASSDHFDCYLNPNTTLAVTTSDLLWGRNQLEYLYTTYTTTQKMLEPFCYSATKHRFLVLVDNGFASTTGGASSATPSVAGLYVAPATLKTRDFLSLSRAFANAIQHAQTLQGGSMSKDSPYVGAFRDSNTEWMALMVYENRYAGTCAGVLLGASHIYYGSSRDRYCNWQFQDFVKDKYGFEALAQIWYKPHTIPAGSKGNDPFSQLQRNMGWTISQLNDLFGTWALLNVNWDFYTNGAVYRGFWGSLNFRGFNGNDQVYMHNKVASLDEVDICRRIFKIPHYQAPQRWGYNIVRLIPDAGATQITVTFRGVVQTTVADAASLPPWGQKPEVIPEPNSDWRWGLVVINTAGASKMTPLQAGATGAVKVNLAANTKEVYMVVTATPSQMQQIMFDQTWNYVYRYPWTAKFEGAWPEGYETNVAGSGCSPSVVVYTPYRLVCTSPPTQTNANGVCTDPGWYQHPNGGGWVQTGINPIPPSTAYIGPKARVYKNATITGSPTITDHAIVLQGTVGGNAVVKALSIVAKDTKVLENAVFTCSGLNEATWGPGGIITGTAMIHGDCEIQGGSTALFTQGYYTGLMYVQPGLPPFCETCQFAYTSGPAPEVTEDREWTYLEMWNVA